MSSQRRRRRAQRRPPRRVGCPCRQTLLVIAVRPRAFQRSAAAVVSSAGRNASMDSSAAVRSSAVPKVVTVDRKVSSCPCRCVQLQRNSDSAEIAGLLETAWIGLDLGQQRRQTRPTRSPPPRDAAARPGDAATAQGFGSAAPGLRDARRCEARSAAREGSARRRPAARRRPHWLTRSASTGPPQHRETGCTRPEPARYPRGRQPYPDRRGIVRRYTGARPAASSNWFCSRRGTSSTVASRNTIARLGARSTCLDEADVAGRHVGLDREV